MQYADMVLIKQLANLHIWCTS